MADSVDAEHVTSDEYMDPHCEPCYNLKGIGVKEHVYCHDCYQFLCSDCFVLHEQFQLRGHSILRGSSMPKSLADKPPRYELCDNHPKLFKDGFCIDHKVLICQSCSSSDHNKCAVKDVAYCCKSLSTKDVETLYEALKTIDAQAKLVRSCVAANICSLEEQKKMMLKETQSLYDKIICKVNELFLKVQSEIEVQYQSQSVVLNQQEERINNISDRLEKSLHETEKLKGKPVDTKVFLMIQKDVCNVNRVIGEFKSLNQSNRLISLSFNSNKLVGEILSSSASFGTVSHVSSGYQDKLEIEYTVFPISMSSSGTPAAAALTPRQSLQNMPSRMNASGSSSVKSAEGGSSTLQQEPFYHVTKPQKYKIDTDDDFCNFGCLITGITTTKCNRRLLVDRNNCKVKLFSRDMKLMSFATVSDYPWDIAVISDQEAVVTADNNKFVKLNISGRNLSIKSIRRLTFQVKGIAIFKDNLIVTCPGNKLPSVKLIDHAGRTFWSVSTNQLGKQLFNLPLYLTIQNNEGEPTVVVTDEVKNTLTLLKAESGDVITTRQLKRKDPRGVTTDAYGNVYVCYFKTHEVSVFNKGLSEERCSLEKRDSLDLCPQAISYEDATHQLIVSYDLCDILECFRLR